MKNSKGALMSRTPEQAAHYPEKKNNIIGLSQDSRFNQLTFENQRLKSLIDDLAFDKSFQARRITELNEEVSRLKKTIADLVLNNGSK